MPLSPPSVTKNWAGTARSSSASSASRIGRLVVRRRLDGIANSLRSNVIKFDLVQERGEYVISVGLPLGDVKGNRVNRGAWDVGPSRRTRTAGCAGTGPRRPRQLPHSFLVKDHPERTGKMA